MSRYFYIFSVVFMISGALFAFDETPFPVRSALFQSVPEDRCAMITYQDKPYQAVCYGGITGPEVTLWHQAGNEVKSFEWSDASGRLEETCTLMPASMKQDTSKFISWGNSKPRTFAQVENFIGTLLGKIGTVKRRLVFETPAGSAPRSRTPQIIAGSAATAALVSLLTWLSVRAYKKRMARRRARSASSPTVA